MDELLEIIKNVEGIDEKTGEAIINYYNGILEIFKQNPLVKQNLLSQIKDKFTGLSLKKFTDTSTGKTSSLSTKITLSLDIENWKYINTFLHELTHLVAKNEYEDPEDGYMIQKNLGLSMGQDDMLAISISKFCEDWKIDGNNYTFDKGTGMILLNEWLTEWMANKFSGMENVELKKDNNGYFRIKTSEGYNGSNIMNLLELTFGTDTLIDLLTGLSYTKEERENNIIPLLGFHKMNEMYDSSTILTDLEKKQLVNESGRFITNPNITISLVNLISKFSNSSKNEELQNQYLGQLMNLLVRTYYQKFTNKLNLCDSPEKFQNLINELSIMQNSLIWNENLEVMENIEYYQIYKKMITQLKDKSQKLGYGNEKFSKLEQTPHELLEKFQEAERKFGHSKPKTTKGGFDIDSDKREISNLFEKYVNIILTEYKDKIPSDLRQRLSSITNFSDYVHIENTGTISLFATPKDSIIHLPLDAYKVMSALSQTLEYGKDKSHKTHDSNNMIINDNTYRDFVQHIILKGATPIEYFKEILLHETMHICGSDGAYALSEGFNELKTREIAQKYGLETSCCGYPKETKIAYELQQLFGKDICDRLAFSDLPTRFNVLKDELGEDAVKLYANVYASMEHQFRPYMDKKYPGVKGISAKCDEYDKIDYSETYGYIQQYRAKKAQTLQQGKNQQQSINTPNVQQIQNPSKNSVEMENSRQNTNNQSKQPFQPNRNIKWNNNSEKERYSSLKETKEKTYTKPTAKVAIKTNPQIKNGYINIIAINLFMGISICILFLFSLMIFSR